MFKKRTNVFIRERNGFNIYAASLGDKEYMEIIKFLKENPLPLNKEAKEKFNETFDDLPKFTNIISVGDPRKVESPIITALIQHVYIDGQKSCRCFMCEDWNKKVIPRLEPLHMDNRSSWNCLIERLLRPNYIIIFKTAINEDTE